MGFRWFLAACLGLLILVGSGMIAAAKDHGGKKNVLTPARNLQPAKKLDVKINAIPWSTLRLKVRKSSSASLGEGIHGPGDFWTPAMLQKVRSGRK
jgi:hypothetical protein